MAADAVASAVGGVALHAASPELRRAVGPESAAALRRSAAEAGAALNGGVGVMEAIYELLSQSIALASTVDPYLDDGGLPPADMDDLDWGSYFGIAVAETIATALAAMAAALEEASEERAFEVLDRVGLDLDVFFAAHLFGELCRLELQEVRPSSGPREVRLRDALQAICAWALALVGRVVGYHRFNGIVLWEWASGDAFWALVLSKGALSIVPAVQTPIDSVDIGGATPPVPLPDELANLQSAALTSVLELSSPAVALSMERGTDSVPITFWNILLCTRRSELAQGAMSCGLPRLLVSAAARAGPAYAPGLVTFLVSLLQPELSLTDLGSPSHASRAMVKEAQSTASALAAHLRPVADALWQQLAEVPPAFGEYLPSQFLHECADLAHFVPPPAALLPLLVEGCAAKLADTSALAALCVLMGNASLPPSPVGMLEKALSELGQDERVEIGARLDGWRSQPTGVQPWLDVLRGLGAGPPLPPPPPPLPPATTEVAPCAELGGGSADGPPVQSGKARGHGGGERMRQLVEAAPPEFRCQLSGRLLLDPVRSPVGYVFERAELSRALGEGRCPLTGQPLLVADCPRDPELRRRVTAWVRQQRAQQSAQPSRLAGTILVAGASSEHGPV
mmetsp:Transcript_119937/g.384033  ORF Transcript_119937/g.384033 Transcript_119937/m.384033 type:complete len:626 (+) Transcript_119937:23-1900(+)